MPTYTPNYNLTLPTVGQTNWGSLVNGDLSTLDTQLKQASGGESPVAYSATPVFDMSLGNVHTMLLTGSCTSSTVINPVPGFHLFSIHQNAVGGHTFVFPASFRGAGVISSAYGTAAANSYAVQVFCYIPSTGVYVAVTALMYGE